MIPKNGSRTNVNPFMAAIGLILFLVVAFYLVKGVFWILGLVAPILLILTLIVDRTVITDYLKWIMKLFKTKWYFGLGAAAGTFFAFPLASAFLFGKAMFKKKMKGSAMGDIFEKRNEDEFTEYEELDSEIALEDIDLEPENLDLPEIEENLNTLDDDSAYENLFENDK